MFNRKQQRIESLEFELYGTKQENTSLILKRIDLQGRNQLLLSEYGRLEDAYAVLKADYEDLAFACADLSDQATGLQEENDRLRNELKRVKKQKKTEKTTRRTR